MTTRPSLPKNRPYDPLGPSPATHRIGRPLSPWKRHWMAHRRGWLTAAVGLVLLAMAAFARWAVSESVRFYSARPATVQPAPSPPPIAVRESARSVRGPVSLQFEIGPLESGERVIVTRDIVKILEERLDRAGIARQPSAVNRLTVVYREEPGRELEVVSPQTRGAGSTASIRPVRIVVKLLLDRPGRSLFPLGQEIVAPAQGPVMLSEPLTPQALQRQHHLLYQRTYQQTLDFLRRVNLPTVAANG